MTDAYYRYVRHTLCFGLACGLASIPLGTVFSPMIHRLPIFSFSMIIWCYLALYALMLCRWTGTSPRSIVFPLMFLLTVGFTGTSLHTFPLLAASLLSWIRSGICFHGPGSRRLGAEMVVLMGGCAPFFCFTPDSVISWALGIWAFFLAQSLYFLIMKKSAADSQPKPQANDFEHSRKAAEALLNSYPE